MKLDLIIKSLQNRSYSSASNLSCDLSLLVTRPFVLFTWYLKRFNHLKRERWDTSHHDGRARWSPLPWSPDSTIQHYSKSWPRFVSGPTPYHPLTLYIKEAASQPFCFITSMQSNTKRSMTFMTHFYFYFFWMISLIDHPTSLKFSLPHLSSLCLFIFTFFSITLHENIYIYIKDSERWLE